MLGVVKIIVFAVTIIGALGMAVILIFDGKMENVKAKFNIGKSKNGNSQETKISQKQKNTSGVINASTKKGNKINILDIDESLPFESIEIFSPDNPIGVIAKKDKHTFIGVIEVFGINYNLLDVAERELLEKSFEILLNGIDYPIQLFIQSRGIDIENYKKAYENRLSDMKKSLDKIHEKISFLTDNGSDTEEVIELKDKHRRLLSQYEYGNKIKDYIVGRCQQKNMLERRYYIVVSHYYNPSKFNEKLTRQEILANAFLDIENKSRSIIGSLVRSKLDGELLEGQELAELLYIAYNKSSSEHYRLENAFESKFSHLYTTSEAVEIKAMKRRLEELTKVEQTLEKEVTESKQEGVA